MLMMMMMGRLTALQRRIDVEGGLLKPRYHADEFLDEGRHHTLQNRGTAPTCTQHVDFDFVRLGDH